MENPIWTAEYQQSVPTDLETTDSHLNNGTRENGEDGECFNTEKEDVKDLIKNEFEKDPELITISDQAKQIISSILEQMKCLSRVEKYLLFLKLSAEVTSTVDPFRQPLNPLGSRSEITKTISWIKTHLEEDPDTSLPKQEVYTEYNDYCGRNSIKPLSQADFGKVMKQVYPAVRARRLGTRGNSRYCYSGLRRCAQLKPPALPDLGDKPMSTEVPFTQANLASVAWLIVKEWSEQLLSQQFSTIQNLAYHLILHHSIGKGSEAASKISSAGKALQKAEECSEKLPSKHRELQLQLQRKIQQKSEGKEKRKRTQSPKTEHKPNPKKSRSQSVPAPIAISILSPTSTTTSDGANLNLNSNASRGECGSSTASSSTSTSPTQAKPICDKTLDFTQLPVLPDFNSFQKPAADGVGGTAEQEQGMMVCNKIPVTRIQPVPPVLLRKETKYKTLRSRLHQCDIVSYNPQSLPAMQLPVQIEDNRSQNVQDIARIKRRNSDDECDVPDFPLTRERLNSVSNVPKDSMDEYLGKNNSQHEEELSKYFNNNIALETEDTTKLSTLRQLLVQNIDKGVPANFVNRLMEAKLSNNLHQLPVQNDYNFINQTPSQGLVTSSSTNIKRRVSFETPHSEDSIPASPNTRRKHFSFTPISPGPQSPSHSKCSSTSASPFVSPRNTPVPRNKPILKSDAKKPAKIKREIDLTVEINKNQFPMSAPVSPMTSNKSVLHELLNSSMKVTYNPSYSTRNLPVRADANFANSNFDGNLEGFRSRSVPLRDMIAPLQHNEFSEIDPIHESDNEKVKQILKSLEPVDELPSNNAQPRELGFNFFNNNIDNGEFSQAVPSRSVPNTPLHFAGPPKGPYSNSRSYPSTPLNSSQTFTYNNGTGDCRDCLLNGQPVLDGLDLNFEMNGDDSTGIGHDKVFSIDDDFDVVASDIDSGLIDSNFMRNIE
ncbi:unnamed protein product [Phyllotreta striolata]|uniref:RFX-type winged-helix domain-containing protein n=1 Tax=Phyllotreta striolata TaxID=444603 RepID=A0A9N9TJ82_PHYSR|nr:unnamed protein product [Phyllotreta striolata]